VFDMHIDLLIEGKVLVRVGHRGTRVALDLGPRRLPVILTVRFVLFEMDC
jgi:hypothetical protein